MVDVDLWDPAPVRNQHAKRQIQVCRAGKSCPGGCLLSACCTACFVKGLVSRTFVLNGMPQSAAYVHVTAPCYQVASQMGCGLAQQRC